MNVLVTGADGFVGSWLVPRLRADGHAVVAGVRAGVSRVGPSWPPGVVELPWEIGDTASVRDLVDRPLDAVVHLAAVASGGDAFQDPATAWEVNATGTVRLVEMVARLHGGVRGPVMLLISTGEVYGVGDGRPRRETDPVTPVSPYAASKAAAELAWQEGGRRTGLRAIIARSFAHTGARQDGRFVVPAFARRIAEARKVHAATVPVGNLAPVRDLLHVNDVVDAYSRLIERGRPGEVYNVSSGHGVALAEVFSRLAALAGWRGEARPSQELIRPTDISHLVGDSTKLRQATDWEPRVTLDETLNEVLRAQAE